MFSVIKNAVAKQFQAMAESTLFRVAVDGDVLWDTYINAFSPEFNPTYKKRTEHDCSCCRHFIKKIGGVVAINDGKRVSIWDFAKTGTPYDVVANAMKELVKPLPIENIWLHTEKTVGTNSTKMLVPDSTEVVSWDHFFVHLPKSAYEVGLRIGPRMSDAKSTHDVMLRSLKEITMDSIDTVLDLIRQNSLYRGSENQFAVQAFRNLKEAFDRVAKTDRDLFVWSQLELPQSVSRIRNTAIGTLLCDISEGQDLEDAVRSFESKVAPMNYKRPTALITKAMIEKARAKVDELGLTSALDRRYATIDDLTINNVLFADRSSRLKQADAFDGLVTKPMSTKTVKKVEKISIDTFLSDIIPHVSSVEVMFENRHTGNLVSLVAPSDPTAPTMFKWGNGFSWSYNGDFADSIKEKVKKAGGNVTGDFRASLSWSNYDDLDLHLTEPNGHDICYWAKYSTITGGHLDVDMNAGCGITRSPVENIVYSNRSRMREGLYTLSVHNFSKREDKDFGFEVEVEFDGNVMLFSYAKPIKSKQTIPVLTFKYTHKNGLEIFESIPSSVATKTVWGIQTQQFHKVSTILLSPNHWDGEGVGNKHYFFMIDGCINDGVARGFFNEFLKSELDPHRKVLEMVGAKMKTEQSNHQLSGIGFSSTQKNHLLCKVSGSFTRTLEVTF